MCVVDVRGEMVELVVRLMSRAGLWDARHVRETKPLNISSNWLWRFETTERGESRLDVGTLAPVPRDVLL